LKTGTTTGALPCTVLFAVALSSLSPLDERGRTPEKALSAVGDGAGRARPTPGRVLKVRGPIRPLEESNR
jgi:hypothetical protein